MSPKMEYNWNTALVIDDHASVREVNAGIAEMLGYTVIPAENGLVGVELFKEHRPGLVMIDYDMPEMNGVDAVRAIREFEQERKSMILAISGDDVWDKFFEVGADSFIGKPYRVADLIKTFRKLEEQYCVVQNQR